MSTDIKKVVHINKDMVLFLSYNMRFSNVISYYTSVSYSNIKKNDYKYSCGSIPYQCCLALLHESRPPLNFFLSFSLCHNVIHLARSHYTYAILSSSHGEKRKKEKKNNHSLNLSIYFSSLIEFEWLVVILYYII